MSFWRTLASCAVTGAVAFVAARATAPQPRAAAARPAATCRAEGVDMAALRVEVRAALRDELAARPASAAPAPAAAAEPPPPAGPSPEQLAAHDRALALIAAARPTGRWDDDDVAQMRQLLAQLDPEQRDDVLHTLLPAINDGELVMVAASRRPF
jgi:hypothetical protein